MSTHPPEEGAASPSNSAAAAPDPWQLLRLPRYEPTRTPLGNANERHSQGLSRLDRLAVAITDKVGSVGFFLLILTWTVLWTGYNLLATQVKGLGWKPFDPFPAFVAYLLISNVIQILLMPLIMVGQNLQGRHTEIRAQLDFEINQKAEKEVMVVLRHLEQNTDLLLRLMRHLECRISDEELRAIAAEQELAGRLAARDPLTTAGAPKPEGDGPITRTT